MPLPSLLMCARDAKVEDAISVGMIIVFFPTGFVLRIIAPILILSSSTAPVGFPASTSSFSVVRSQMDVTLMNFLTT